MNGITVNQALRYIFSIFLIVTTSFAFAQTPQENSVKRRIAQQIGKDVQIQSVTKTPYLGLYEVRIGNQIIYTDENAEYLFTGQILNAKTKESYTRNRLIEINRVKFSDLPKELALKTVKGNGERVIAVFSDPNCLYCKNFEKTLQGMDNITIYTFLYNLLSGNSKTLSRNIWCSSNPNQAWHDWMINNIKPPSNTNENCVDPNEKIRQLGSQLGINGVPAIIFIDGSRISGAAEATDLEEKFTSVNK